jgi:nucleotide-binding universal stress UspA family protein
MWTFPPRRIVVAVDFGAASAAATRIAGQLARAFEARLTAVHAETIEAPPYFTSEQVKAIERERRAARTEARRYLARFVEPLAGMPVESVVSQASPASGILEAAREADLIVMGTHGRRGPARWWAGSVAERVVRESRAPVLVVREGRGAPADPFKRIHVIAAAGTNDGPARRYARGLGSVMGGEVARDTSLSLRDARTEGATLAVIARPARQSLSWLTDAAGDALRSNRGPMLFVPPV